MSEGAADGGECNRHGLCSSIAGRGRVAGAIKACLVSIGFGSLAAVGPAFAQAPQNGDELARMMITALSLSVIHAFPNMTAQRTQVENNQAALRS